MKSSLDVGKGFIDPGDRGCCAAGQWRGVVPTVYHVCPWRTMRWAVQSGLFIRLCSLAFSFIGTCTLYGSLIWVSPLARVTFPQFILRLSHGHPLCNSKDSMGTPWFVTKLYNRPVTECNFFGDYLSLLLMNS